MACFSSMQEDQPCENQEQLLEVKNDSAWSAFELPLEFLTNSGSDPLFCTVEILGLSKQDYGDQNPVIVANLNSVAVKRVRRNTKNDSKKNCTCCLLDYYISFKELGWSWIVAPLGFNANMCYGKCDYELDSYPSNYHRMMSKILFNKASSDDNSDNLWTPHCSPTKLRPLYVVYITSDSPNKNSSSPYVHHIIPDMITESCGCF
ncbi:TGF_BETA_2 domain-containing protein [Trichonephila clavata]|uniref:TGF_BETA_2 domain-containing protein n=1 Tax=Trichonephila clavata TaxID=2740835 RepID=A0A8X6J8A4_TRICU|nr:TGF_BETA_2 domain-containing protein [Trichonephila clavata]